LQLQLDLVRQISHQPYTLKSYHIPALEKNKLGHRSSSMSENDYELIIEGFSPVQTVLIIF
jgi:hypothetical protein